MFIHSLPLRCRPYTTRHQPPFIHESFSSNLLYVFGVGRRFLKFSAIGLLALGTTTATAYEALHQYVEHVQLAPEADPEARKLEWHYFTECWSGDPVRGGTDPSLGFRGRHTLRAAWMAYNWGVGYSTAIVDSGANVTEGLPGPGGTRVVDAALQRTDEFLRSAIRIAEGRTTSGSLNPNTLNALLLRHASVLERLGGSFRMASRAEYERAWSAFPVKGTNAAYVAWKLGDLNSRLGQGGDALAWWTRAILLACGKNSEGNEHQSPNVPSIAPSSPQAQRTLTNTLVSLSAFYAMSGQFRKAQEVEESALNLIRSIPPPESSAAATPAQALHALFLLHRSSLLSIHLAEVLHAQKQPAIISIQWLTSAAESSERVTYALTGLALDSFRKRDSVTQAREGPLLETYKSSRSMNRVAASLLRDASRTAAEAWNLIGVLHEAKEGPGSENALKCYERAVDWAGTTPLQSDARVAAGGTLEADWNLFWSNYNRVKQHIASQTK
ncbi:hypothetical protein AX15_003878 [Amanita polypyramis BW_CC]|nr:hypothetical protein AX15_003878 [Amanita polypyramis BW_CC]